MARVKKIWVAGSVLLSLEVLSLAVLLGTGFACCDQVGPALLTAVPSVNTSAVRLDLPVKNADSFIFEKDGETTPDSGCLLAGTKPAQVFFRSHAASPACFKVVFTPKVSRCISKSVLNL